MDVSLTSLVLPILLSGVGVFIASFVMWMVLPHHRNDYGKVPDEDKLMGTLGDLPEGQYAFPHCSGPEQMKDPAWVEKRNAGPSGMLMVLPRGPMKMGASMGTSFFFNVLVSLIVAYVATIGLKAGADAKGDVFRMTSTVGFLAYSAALAWGAIWYGHTWSSTLKSMFDGLVYGLLTGLIFMLFWPTA